MKHYTVGYALSLNLESVLLIKKARPDWQCGKLNGIGGKRERGESSIGCMICEFEEETGVCTSSDDWRLISTLYFPGIVLDVYATMNPLAFVHARTTTDEEVVRISLLELMNHSFVENVPALLDLCEQSFRSEAATLERTIRHFS